MQGKDFAVDNISVSFGTDLINTGSTAISNLLLRHYKALGISDVELVLIINLIYLRCEEKDLCPTAERLSLFMNASCGSIVEMLAELMEKRFITISKEYVAQENEVVDGYSLAPLMEQLFCIWAREKQMQMLEIQRQGQGLKNNVLSNACKAFEKEFGRLLSPVEVEQIRFWVVESKIGGELIQEALRRASLMGVHNLKYIDKILLEWQKRNLVTLESVLNYEANHDRKASKPIKSKRVPEKVAENDEDKFRLLHWGNFGDGA